MSETEINGLKYSTFIPDDNVKDKLRKEINSLKKENEILRRELNENDKNKVIKEHIKKMSPFESFVLFYLKIHGFLKI